MKQWRLDKKNDTVELFWTMDIHGDTVRSGRRECDPVRA